MHLLAAYLPREKLMITQVEVDGKEDVAMAIPFGCLGGKICKKTRRLADLRKNPVARAAFEPAIKGL